MIKLQGPSQILTKDELLSVFREGTRIPENVAYFEGKPIKRNGFKFTCQGNVQPLDGRQLMLVPEGDRTKEQYYIFAPNNSFVVDSGLQIQDKPTRLLDNDIITRLGVNYQLQDTEDWGSYSKARMVRIDVGPDASI